MLNKVIFLISTMVAVSKAEEAYYLPQLIHKYKRSGN